MRVGAIHELPLQGFQVMQIELLEMSIDKDLRFFVDKSLESSIRDLELLTILFV